MEEMPSRERLILLVNSLCKIQDKILPQWGVASDFQRQIAAKIEPLKAPMFFLWEKLGYGSPTELSARGINGYWMASFHTSPYADGIGFPLQYEHSYFYQASLECHR